MHGSCSSLPLTFHRIGTKDEKNGINCLYGTPVKTALVPLHYTAVHVHIHRMHNFTCSEQKQCAKLAAATLLKFASLHGPCSATNNVPLSCS